MSQMPKKVKTISNLETNDCRWPYGDPRHADFHFCGAQQVLGRPYCAQHAAMSFDAAKSRHNAPTTPIPSRRAA